jgi:hypothetical protein
LTFTISALLVAGLLLLYAAWHRPGWVVFVALSAAALLDLFQIGTDGVSLGVTLYIDDAACVVSLGTGLLMLKKYPKNFPRDAIPCLILLGFVVLNAGRGASAFGLKAAGNGVRDLFFFLTPALAIMLLRPAFRLDAVRLARWLGWAGFCLSGVALLRWAGLLPIPIGLEDSFREVVRVLPSDYAIIVGLAFIAAIHFSLVERRSALWWIGAAMLGVIALALQHRSVWVATAAGLAWLAYRALRISPARLLAVGATASVAMCVILVAAPRVLNSAREMVTVNVEEAESENSTWEWRVEGYQEATDRLFASDLVVILIGPPAGWAADLVLEDIASTIIHSRYIDTLANYGVVGFAVLLVWFGMLTKRVGWPAKPSRSAPERGHTEATLLEALLLSALVYLVPYYGSILEGAVLGLIWVAATQNDGLIGVGRVDSTHRQLDPKNLATLPS